VLKIVENLWSELSARAPLGELTMLPQTLKMTGMGIAAPSIPMNPSPLSAFGLEP